MPPYVQVTGRSQRSDNTSEICGARYQSHLAISCRRRSHLVPFLILSIPLHDSGEPVRITRPSRDHLARCACGKVSHKISAPLFLSHLHLLAGSKQSWTSNDSTEYDMLRSSIESSSLLHDSLSISWHLVSDIEWKLRQRGRDREQVWSPAGAMKLRICWIKWIKIKSAAAERELLWAFSHVPTLKDFLEDSGVHALVVFAAQLLTASRRPGQREQHRPSLVELLLASKSLYGFGSQQHFWQ